MKRMDFETPLCAPCLMDGSGERGAHGVLIMHGFTGSPAQMRPLADAIHGAGYTVSVLRLPGHCTSLEDMACVGWSDYLRSARAGYDELARRCAHVSVVGLSMGGLLALLLSAERPVEACITLSAAIRPRNRLAPFAGVLKYVVPRVLRWPESAVDRGEDFLHEYDYGYYGMPLRRVDDLMKLSRRAQGALGDVRCPLLVIQSARDETVDPVSADIIMQKAASARKRELRLERSGHIVTLGPEREQVWRAVCDWLTDVTG